MTRRVWADCALVTLVHDLGDRNVALSVLLVPTTDEVLESRDQYHPVAVRACEGCPQSLYGYRVLQTVYRSIYGSEHPVPKGFCY